MSLSRRKFTKEFKEAAVRRLEMGASIAEVARACEVNPNVLHRWRRELAEHGSTTRSVSTPHWATARRRSLNKRSLSRRPGCTDALF